MSVIGKLASSLGRRDEIPNQELARDIVKRKDKRAVAELVENLSNRDKNIQGDCIKALYEIGAQEPSLIAPFGREFVALLESKTTRLVWGAMIALDAIALENPKSTFAALDKILHAADNSGSVIARDHAVGILAKLAGLKPYAGKVFPLLIEQLTVAPTNQLPMYAEKSLPIINSTNSASFVKTLVSRLKGFEAGPKRKRIEKILDNVQKIQSQRQPKKFQ